MYYIAKGSRSKIAHTDNCQYLKNVRSDNKIKYTNPDAVRKAGYRFCRCCAPIMQNLKQQQASIEEFCRKYNVSYQIDLAECSMNVVTESSQWKIIVSGKRNQIFLYHKNFHRYGYRYNDPVPGYHHQNVREDNILAYLEYIVKHDEFRKKTPAHRISPKDQELMSRNFRKGSKKYKAREKRLKNKERLKDVAKVLDLLDAVHTELQYKENSIVS